MDETNDMKDDMISTDGTEEEKLLRGKNIPGLTISSRNHEEEILKQLNKHFEEQIKANSSTDNETSKNDTSSITKMLETDETKETENEREIRLGKMTPFGTTLSTNVTLGSQNDQILQYLKRQEDFQKQYQSGNSTQVNIRTTQKCSTFSKAKKRRNKIPLGSVIGESIKIKKHDPMLNERLTVNFEEDSDSEYVPSSDELSSEIDEDIDVPSTSRKRRKRNSDDDPLTDNEISVNMFVPKTKRVAKEIDDGDESEYQSRLNTYEKLFNSSEILFYEFENTSFKLPLEIWSKLFEYQKVGVQWLWELHQQTTGGILGDEMGLGKTIQVIAFFSGLFYSKLKNKYNSFRGLGPSLIVCPTTLMYQWVKEFHIWLPPLRVAILHACGSFSGNKQNLIKDIYRSRGILITSYTGMTQMSDELLRYNWHYAILDEGHKIRNPDAKVTLSVKQLKTPHRLILSGSPLQNNLEELWSLFDFIYPGKLGALPLFQSQFTVPITHGGYANASNTEVTIAYKCATVLKELISPYLLRRSKQDVKSHIDLPAKNEQVLFCQLTDVQRNLYKSYIDSGDVTRILEGQAQIFVGLINLRKICNHPDLYTNGAKSLDQENVENTLEENCFGHWKKSGKMIVLETLLKIWRNQNHKVLLFTQSRKMLNILEVFLCSYQYKYLKMDGSTCIGSRQPLINTFNSDPEYFVMLLTTKVGGLGVNLTGANRVVIFDPDWNPATDTQAKERAWRIGQTQDVTVYRLVTAGTIEEKMYHRQIFKQFLTNKVLKDPKQRRFFKSNDLFELFTLKESSAEGSTETGAIFAGTGSEINLDLLSMRKKMKERQLREEIARGFSPDKIEKMRLIAQQISQKLGQQKTSSANETDGTNDDKSSQKVEYSDPNGNINNKTVTQLSKKVSSTSVTSETTVSNEKKLSKKKNRKSYFEGEYVPYLVASKKTKLAKMPINEINSSKTEEDEYVLKKLFSKAGICSALQHDTIMEGGPADFAIIEKEAEKIADQAIKELKRNQETCFPAHTGIPNWTGKCGVKGKNFSSSKVLSSSDILDKIKKRNGIVDSATAETKLLSDLQNFIMSNGGTSSTERLINNFQSKLPPTMTPLFKCLLNKTCSFYRGPDKKGYWTLKNEFSRL